MLLSQSDSSEADNCNFEHFLGETGVMGPDWTQNIFARKEKISQFLGLFIVFTFLFFLRRGCYIITAPSLYFLKVNKPNIHLPKKN